MMCEQCYLGIMLKIIAYLGFKYHIHIKCLSCLIIICIFKHAPSQHLSFAKYWPFSSGLSMSMHKFYIVSYRCDFLSHNTFHILFLSFHCLSADSCMAVITATRRASTLPYIKLLVWQEAICRALGEFWVAIRPMCKHWDLGFRVLMLHIMLVPWW